MIVECYDLFYAYVVYTLCSVNAISINDASYLDERSWLFSYPSIVSSF